jgi:FMN phosphatase YigB (HAD superfamily)/DNA-binding XRE family transcriptional regulator
MDEKGLGRRLQDARVKAGLTQQALCQKAGLSYSTLTKIERGAIKAPSIFTIQSIVDALGTTLNGLMEGTGASSPALAKHRSKSGITFVYFDINGCLVRFYHRAFTQIALLTEAPADIIETTFWHYNDQVCRGDMTMSEFNRIFSKALGVPKIDWQEQYLDAIDPIPSMHELVKWASQNYHVGLLTNIMPGFVDAMKKRGQIPDVHYDTIVDSSKVHAIKPEVAIYEIAAQRAGCPPSEILFVDDAQVNLMAAEKQGWRVLLFDDYRPQDSAKRIRESLEIAE